MNEWLLLKWGTLKGWNLETQKSKDAFKRYADAGMSLSAMTQQDTAEQKQALCDLIDVIEGKIDNDWSGKSMTKDEAKNYVMTYGCRE